jgi:hypothetical protein
LSYGSYDETEVLLDLLHADMLAGDERLTVRSPRAPELAVDEHHPVAADDALVADHALDANRGGHPRST